VGGRGTKSRQLSATEVNKPARADLANYQRFDDVSEPIVAVSERIYL
jgi:hypothetical protein